MLWKCLLWIIDQAIDQTIDQIIDLPANIQNRRRG